VTAEIPNEAVTVYLKSQKELSIYLSRKRTSDVVRFRVAATPCLTRFQFTPLADLVPPLRPLPRYTTRDPLTLHLLTILNVIAGLCSRDSIKARAASRVPTSLKRLLVFRLTAEVSGWSLLLNYQYTATKYRVKGCLPSNEENFGNLFKTQSFGDWILFPSSSGTYSVGLNRWS
jgi:hypothetical protein